MFFFYPDHFSAISDANVSTCHLSLCKDKILAMPMNHNRSVGIL
jgi:hypothetical protein